MNGCNIGTDYCDYAIECYQEREPIARKEYKCCECGGIIPKGQKYERIKGKWEGDFETYKTCLICAEIRNVLSDGNAVQFGMLWSDVREILPEMGFACIEELSIPAKERMIEAWRTYNAFRIIRKEVHGFQKCLRCCNVFHKVSLYLFSYSITHKAPPKFHEKETFFIFFRFSFHDKTAQKPSSRPDKGYFRGKRAKTTGFGTGFRLQ